MPILRSDLKLIKAADMSDFETGGGLPSANVIVDGKSNEIFDDITDLNRAMGGVSLRKVFAKVDTANTDKLMASRMLISKLPTNPHVSVFMFDTGLWGDTRKNAADKLASYYSLSSIMAGHLLEKHLTGQRVVQLSLDLSDAVPLAGQKIALVQNDGQSDSVVQFVSIVRVSTIQRTFQRTVDTTVKRIVASLEISEPLRYDFDGLTVPEFYARVDTSRRAIVREARGSEAVKIYSASQIKEPITLGSSTFKINSIYTQIIPATSTETQIPPTQPFVDGSNQSDWIDIGSVAYGLVYSKTLSNTPTANTLKIVYQSSGQLYEASDIDGVITDSYGQNIGTLDSVSKLLSLNLPTLPDAGTVIAIRYQTTNSNVQANKAAFYVPVTPIKSLSFGLTVTYDYSYYYEQTQTVKSGTTTSTVFADKYGSIDLFGNEYANINYLTGLVTINATRMVLSSVSYTASTVANFPLSQDIIGLDVSRMPDDGKAQFVKSGDFGAVVERKAYELTTPTANKSYDLGVVRLTTVDIKDSTGKALDAAHVNIDLDAGTLTLTASFDMSGYTAPLSAHYLVQDLIVVNAVGADGTITANKPISHDYSTDAIFSTLLVNNGDGVVQTRAHNVYSQKSWDNVWRNTLFGDSATIQLNTAIYPIVVTNNAAITEQWALVFTSATDFKIIGKSIGLIGTGSTTSDTFIYNLNANAPYFTIPQQAWSGGGAAGNVVFFNTESAMPQVWLGSAVMPHDGLVNDVYDFTIEHQANIDRERIA